MSAMRVPFCSALVFGSAFLSQSFARADPPADNCTDTCQNKAFFIAELTGNCYEYAEGDCLFCSGGRCREALATPPKCKPVPDADGKELKVQVKFHNKGACAALCTLNAGKYSQADKPSSEDFVMGDVTKRTCQPLADGDQPPIGGEN